MGQVRDHVEFERVAVGPGDQFHLSHPDGPVAFVFPKQGVAVEGFVVETGGQAHPFQGMDFDAVKLLRVGGFGHVHAGGHDVDEVGQVTAVFTFGGDTIRPVNDEGTRYASLVGPVFEHAERGVGSIAPIPGIPDVGIFRARHDAETHFDRSSVPRVVRNHFSLALIFPHGFQLFSILGGLISSVQAVCFRHPAVVLKEKDEGMVELVLFLQGFYNASDSLIHIVDLSGINFHASFMERFVFRLFPWDGGITIRQFPPPVDQPHVDHALVAFLAQCIPTPAVAPLIFFNVRRQGVQRPVSSGVGNVNEVGVFARVISNMIDGGIADGIGVVKPVRGNDEFISRGEGIGIIKTAGPVNGAEELVEPSLQRPIVF